jgi:hypothetical protein
MRRVRSLLLLMLAMVPLALGAACGPKSGQVKLTEQVERQGQWQKVLKEHTRRNQHYLWSSLEADLRATLVTPRLRSAFVQDRGSFHGAIAREFGDDLLKLGEPPDEGMDAPLQTRPDAEEEVLVFISMFVRDAKHRDLDASYSIWDIELMRGEAVVRPIDVERVRYSPGLVDIVPYVDRFDKSYMLRFPLVDADTGQPMMSPGGEPLRLRIVSALGEVITEWKLVGEGEGIAVPSVPLPKKKAAPGNDESRGSETKSGDEADKASDETPAAPEAEPGAEEGDDGSTAGDVSTTR